MNANISNAKVHQLLRTALECGDEEMARICRAALKPATKRHNPEPARFACELSYQLAYGVAP